MCILLKLHCAKFGVSDLFFSKVIEGKPLEVGSIPGSCVEIMKTSISVARFCDFAVSSACYENKMNNVLC